MNLGGDWTTLVGLMPQAQLSRCQQAEEKEHPSEPNFAGSLVCSIQSAKPEHMFSGMFNKHRSPKAVNSYSDKADSFEVQPNLVK